LSRSKQHSRPFFVNVTLRRSLRGASISNCIQFLWNSLLGQVPRRWHRASLSCISLLSLAEIYHPPFFTSSLWKFANRSARFKDSQIFPTSSSISLTFIPRDIFNNRLVAREILAQKLVLSQVIDRSTSAFLEQFRVFPSGRLYIDWSHDWSVSHLSRDVCVSEMRDDCDGIAFQTRERDSRYFSRGCRVSRDDALFFSHPCLHTLPCKHLAVSLCALRLVCDWEGRHSRSAYAANDKYLRPTLRFNH